MHLYSAGAGALARAACVRVLIVVYDVRCKLCSFLDFRSEGSSILGRVDEVALV